jgi:hypothetical protein
MPRKSDTPPVQERKPILGKGWQKPLDPRLKTKMLPLPRFGTVDMAEYLRQLDAYTARFREVMAEERALKREDAKKAREGREKRRKPDR